MTDQRDRVRRLIDDAAVQLRNDAPWIVVALAPDDDTPNGFPGIGELKDWLVQQVAMWPAPFDVESSQPRTSGGAVIITPSRTSTGAASGHYFQFHSDGSALGAIPVGSRRPSPHDQAEVWAIGEGGVAWLSIALLRLAALSIGTTNPGASAAVALSIVSPPGAHGAVPLELWSNARHTDGPLIARTTHVEPSVHMVDLATCRTAGVALAARLLLIDVLRQFGLPEPLHIAPDGNLRCSYFTGHDQLIRGWAHSIGIRAEP